MTKENTSLCITPGKEQGMNCQTDSLNTFSLVILNLLPGPETDLLTFAHLTGSWDCRKMLQLLLFLHLVSRGSQFKVNHLLYIQNHSQSRKNKPPLIHLSATDMMTQPLPLAHLCKPNKYESEGDASYEPMRVELSDKNASAWRDVLCLKESSVWKKNKDPWPK